MPDSINIRTTAAKALRVNLDVERYGAFAEIGAGQEVARHFFQVGKAAQTIAKSMSAYDMTYSDEIYGREKSGRYVCESRLQRMIEKEYNLLIKRLHEKRGAQTAFFAFANTVATGTPETPRCHGWMGVRFQSKPGGPVNDIVLHVRMMDRTRLQQQEALGVLGVNLIEAAFYGLNKPEEFIPQLVENLKSDQLVIDVIRFSGPDLAAFDNRRMNLELIRLGLAEAVLFGADGSIWNVSDAIYAKALLIQRGTFRPVTSTHADVAAKGLAQLKADLAAAGDKKTEAMALMEIVLPRGTKPKEVADYEQRLDWLAAAGFSTLVSDLPLFYQLKHFLRKATAAPVSIILGASRLERLFDEKHYKTLDGGLLEGLGRLFDQSTKIAVYPHKTDQVCLTAKLYRPKGPAQHIYNLFFEKGQIRDIVGCDETGLYYHSTDVMRLVESKDKAWEKLVPAAIVPLVKKRKEKG